MKTLLDFIEKGVAKDADEMDEIVKEAKRVLKEDEYAFDSVLALNIEHQLKVRLGPVTWMRLSQIIGKADR